ncbi:TlpA disulfide reductase family protein [Fodinibius sp.]|uniref:TlpA disulfide reductase family protein n=1 Tax=Fodinibius sp. TaxID=1872440 RepID=UPI002ACD937C|nr:TlpA disulfide reductase family protein [Fodinibius sp.]MDZ7658779.1 TlpA disulfide reductase family protein [Fodinibius sp.]
MMKNRFYLYGLIIVFSAFLFLGCNSESESQKKGPTQPLEQLDPSSAILYPAQREAKAKDFEVTTLNGETFTLSDYEGQVVLLNIWATWCAPCREETPDLQELYEKYKDNGFMILGVSIDEQGESVVRPFIEKYEVSYPIVIDDGTIMDKYGPTMGIPTTYIINKKGNLQYFAVGALTNKELEPRIKNLLSE